MASGQSTEPLEGNSKYAKVSDLGRGSYGIVQLATDKTTGEEVAIKFVPRGDQLPHVYLEREIINHSILYHPHIIQFKEVFLTPEHLAIAMEYAPGGDMFQYVSRRGGLAEREARWFFHQLIVALDYCHRMGVKHRDIKLENTLLDGNRRPLLKLCDFGYSKHSEMHSSPGSRVGTPGYTAPEVISNRGTYVGERVDVWSSGVMLYVMLFCRYPFERASDEEETQQRRIQLVMERVLKGDYSFPSSMRVSDSCKDLLQKILTVDPALRITIEGIQQHPWYLEDLPPGLSHFNDTCINAQQRNPAEMERTAAHVCTLVGQARERAAAAGAGSAAVPPLALHVGAAGGSSSEYGFDSEEIDHSMMDFVDENGNFTFQGSFGPPRR